MNADTRLKLGIGLLILGLIMPAGTFFVVATDWPSSVKTVVSGILLAGLEIMAIPPAALMGKETFDRMVSAAKGFLKTMKPGGDVSRTRYTIGLVLFVVPLLLAWIAAYLPASWLPADYTGRVWFNLALDAVTIVSLFVLGG